MFHEHGIVDATVSVRLIQLPNYTSIKSAVILSVHSLPSSLYTSK